MLSFIQRALSAALVFSLPFSALAFDIKHGKIPVQLGGFIGSEGTNQRINIENVWGNQYIHNNDNPINGLVGLGYYVDGIDVNRFHVIYGANVFYLAKTPMDGNIAVEHVFTNLAYHYDLQNVPLYVGAKAFIKTENPKLTPTIDVGLGPNFMRLSNYQEAPLTSYSVASNNFTAHNNVAFSATAGIGLQINNALGKRPIECGYRFFYLGSGQLQANNSQLLNTLKTGPIHANALLCASII